ASLADHRHDAQWIVGTPGYTPPECLLGEAHEAAGDLFSLGVILHQALTGRAPFAKPNLSETLLTTISGKAPKLDELAPQAPLPLRRLVDQLIDRYPAARPGSALQVGRRLRWIAEALVNPVVDLEEIDPAETMPIAMDG
ncbi:MAG: hypothetical protein AAGE94_22405, partial [Acidobacteriota bacterium]